MGVLWHTVGCPDWAWPQVQGRLMQSNANVGIELSESSEYLSSKQRYIKCSVQNSITFPTLLLKSSKKVVFLSEISSK